MDIAALLYNQDGELVDSFEAIIRPTSATTSSPPPSAEAHQHLFGEEFVGAHRAEGSARVYFALQALQSVV